MEDPVELRKSFERAGVIAIQAQQDANRATGAPMQDREIEARKWLAEKAAEAAASLSAKRDARDEETLAVAKDANTIALSAAVAASDANDIARSARKIALIAAIAAIVAAIAAIKWR